jgi:para-aminobenzoate synthetase/4-amino-4-deoxychorismate lyase
MIVDMTRNDLGKIAEIGSVSVPKLFEIERYPTVWQMTSTVTATSQATFTDVLTALFPCASITGAPKRRTMQIITELEDEPRRVYTGCIGYLAPGQIAQFSVAIRTVIVDRETRQAEYGVGGGIVWDSQADEEYAECQDKARALTERKEPFSLLETLRWTPEDGYFLLDYHLRRLSDSADYFGFELDPRRVVAELEELAAGLSQRTYKIRLLAQRDGSVTAEATMIELSEQPLRLALAVKPVDSNDKFLFHKTTRRQVYDEALAEHRDADDVILWNERGELTETCLGNLVLKIGDRLVTPPLDCGLLAGTLRAYLLERGEIDEGVLTLDSLERCEEIYRINSVRGWQRAEVESR